MFFVGWLSPLFKFLKEWLPWFAEIEATISVHVIWMHFYFYGFSDETVPLSGFCGKEFGIWNILRFRVSLRTWIQNLFRSSGKIELKSNITRAQIPEDERR
jgi:hypothetical protein